MIGVEMLCHNWCVDVMSCLLFVCYVMICVWMLRHALMCRCSVMISVWMFCHDWCWDVMS